MFMYIYNITNGINSVAKMGKQIDEDWRYPLRYPPGIGRTPRSQRQIFQHFDRWQVQSVSDARDLLLQSLKALGARDVIISSNTPVNGQGKLSGNSKEPEDTGVAVYFRLDRVEMEICCDRWIELKDNLYALSVQVNILRLQREIDGSVFMQKSTIPHQHGKHESSRQQKHQRQSQPSGGKRYKSKTAPQQQPSSRSWAIALGVKEGDSLEDIRKAYHRLAKKYHSDAGGDEEMMKHINNAWDEAKAAKLQGIHV